MGPVLSEVEASHSCTLETLWNDIEAFLKEKGKSRNQAKQKRLMILEF
jgi:hypothetical protein